MRIEKELYPSNAHLQLDGYVGLFFNQANNEKKHQSPNNRSADGAEDPSSQVDVENRAEKPIPDEGPEDADNNVSQQSKTISLPDLAGQPAGDCADDEREDQVVGTHRMKSLGECFEFQVRSKALLFQ